MGERQYLTRVIDTISTDPRFLQTVERASNKGCAIYPLSDNSGRIMVYAGETEKILNMLQNPHKFKSETGLSMGEPGTDRRELREPKNDFDLKLILLSYRTKDGKDATTLSLRGQPKEGLFRYMRLSEM